MISPLKLIYFTNSYPYGSGETWKTRELQFLKQHFNRILVVPLDRGNPATAVSTIEGIEYCQPLMVNEMPPKNLLNRKIGFIRFVLSRHKTIAREVTRNRRRIINWKNVIKLLRSLQFIYSLISNAQLKEILAESDEETILYFFWGRGTSEIFPFIQNICRFKKAVCRMHGYDLYLDRNNGYIPFQSQQIRCFDLILPCSFAGEKELISQYENFKNKIRVLKLGVDFDCKNDPSDDGILRLVSCSNVIELKRVHLIFDAIQKLDIPLVWTHFGDGDLFSELVKRVLYPKSNIKVDLKGYRPNSDVYDHYRKMPVDLFLNVSETEGVPVSIMEALSFGIPVVATDVGGTREIVSSKSGFLLEKNFQLDEVARILAEYYTLPGETKKLYRKGAYQSFRENCDNLSLSKKLLESLKSD